METLSEFFEMQPTPDELNHSIRMLFRLFNTLHLPIDRIEYEIFYPYKIREKSCDGPCKGHLVKYYPMFSNTYRSISKVEAIGFQPEAWKDYTYLGSIVHPTSSLIPLALVENEVDEKLVEMTPDGHIYMHKDSIIDADTIYYTAERLRNSNTFSYLASNENDALIALELTNMMGGSVKMEPIRTTPLSSKDPQFHLILNLPEFLRSEDMFESIERIRSGSLPYLKLNGPWTSLPNRTLQAENVRQKAIISTIGTLAYTVLSKQYPYLTSSILDIYTGSTHSLNVPLASWKQRILFEKKFREILENRPFSTWSIVTFETWRELLVYRFYYEKMGFFTFVPSVQPDIGGEIRRQWMITDGPSMPPRGDEFDEAEESLLYHLNKGLDNKLSKSKNKGNKGKTALQISREIWNQDEYVNPGYIQLYSYYGYAQSYPLQGLYQNLPTPPSLQEDERGIKIVEIDSILTSHILHTNKGHLYIKTQDPDETLRQWNENILPSRIWKMAILHSMQEDE